MSKIPCRICCFLFITFCGLYCLCAEEQPLGISNVHEIENVVKQFRSNIESIRTWSGEAIVEETREPREGRTSLSRKTKIIFWFDVPSNRKLLIIEPIEEIQLSLDGTSIPIVYKNIRLLILPEEATCYRYTAINSNGLIPIADKDNHNRYVLGKNVHDYDRRVLRGDIYISSNTDLHFDISNPAGTFDPFATFDLMGNYLVRADVSIQSARDNTQMEEVKTYIDSQGEFVSLIERLDNKSINLSVTYTVDRSLRGCLVKYINIVPNLAETYVIVEHECYADIFVPKKVVFDAKKIGIKNTITFAKSMINEKIPDDIFSLKTLKVMRGDAVYDERTDTHYVIDDDQYPLPDYATGFERTSTKFLRYVFIGGGLLLIAFSLILKYRKRQQEAF